MPECSEGRNKPPFHSYESGDVVHTRSKWVSLHCKNAVPCNEISHKRIDLAVQSRKHWIVQPGLLHELELPFNITIETNEYQSSLRAIIHHRVSDSFSVRT